MGGESEEGGSREGAIQGGGGRTRGREGLGKGVFFDFFIFFSILVLFPLPSVSMPHSFRFLVFSPVLLFCFSVSFFSNRTSHIQHVPGTLPWATYSLLISLATYSHFLVTGPASFLVTLGKKNKERNAGAVFLSPTPLSPPFFSGLGTVAVAFTAVAVACIVYIVSVGIRQERGRIMVNNLDDARIDDNALYLARELQLYR